MPSLTFLVSVEYRRESGKFAPREDIVEAISAALRDASIEMYDLGADGDSIYEVDEIEVEEYVPPKKVKT